MDSQAPTYEEALKCLKFSYTRDSSGMYINLGSTDVNFQTPTEREPLFAPALQRLHTLYPGSYTHGSTSTLESIHGGTEYRQKRSHEGKEVVATDRI